MSSSTSPLILVTSATGKTGRRVAERLDQRGVACRRACRSTPIPFDWQRPASWSAALDGVTAVYLAFAPDLATPGAVDTVRRFATAAVDAGVTKLVLLAGRGEDEALATEAVVRASGAAWTILLASWFAQNFDEDYLLESVLAGEIALPVGNIGEPFVDADDIADVAVAALTDRVHDGRTYDLTGPRMLTFADAATEISMATGRAIEFVRVSPADHRAGAIAHGVPDAIAEMLTDLFVRVLDGRNAYVGEGVSEALGRPARDFTDYARRVAATGVWGSARPAVHCPPAHEAPQAARVLG